MERRYGMTPGTGVTTEARATGKGRRLSGYAAIFYDGTPGSQYDLRDNYGGGFVERINSTAFTKALARPDDVRGLLGHDPNWIFARSTAGTLRLKVDATGLYFQADVPDTAIGEHITTAVERGDINQCSFSFAVDDQVWREEKAADGSLMVIRELVSVRLYDVSVVSFAAYGGTSVGVRAPADMADGKADFDRWKNRGGIDPFIAKVAARAREVELDIINDRMRELEADDAKWGR
jgi:uncharacterized protein